MVLATCARAKAAKSATQPKRINNMPSRASYHAVSKQPASCGSRPGTETRAIVTSLTNRAMLRFVLIAILCTQLATASPARRKRHRNHRSMVVSMSKFAGQGAGIGMFGGPIGAGIGALAGAGFGYWQDRKAHHPTV